MDIRVCCISVLVSAALTLHQTSELKRSTLPAYLRFDLSPQVRWGNASALMSQYYMSESGARPLTAPCAARQMTWSHPQPLTRHLSSQRPCTQQTHTCKHIQFPKRWSQDVLGQCRPNWLSGPESGELRRTGRVDRCHGSDGGNNKSAFARITLHCDSFHQEEKLKCFLFSPQITGCQNKSERKQIII